MLHRMINTVHNLVLSAYGVSEVGGSETGMSVTPDREIVFRVRDAIARRSCVGAKRCFVWGWGRRCDDVLLLLLLRPACVPVNENQ